MGNNYGTIQHMIDYCYAIERHLSNNNVKTYDDFRLNETVQDAVVMRLLALGELTTHLTDEFKTANASFVDWRNLKQLRNVIAHRYGSIQFDTVWEIIQNDIPKIRDFCVAQIEQSKEKTVQDIDTESEL